MVVVDSDVGRVASGNTAATVRFTGRLGELGDALRLQVPLGRPMALRHLGHR